MTLLLADFGLSIADLGEAAAEVGQRLLQWRTNSPAGKWIGTQFKAEADERAHETWVARLREVAADLPVVSEEDPQTLGRPVEGGAYWLIDPIDGTASFAHGFPGFVTQVALMSGSAPVAAAIAAPVYGQVYTGELGGGAFLNGRRLRVATAPQRRILIDNYPEPHGIAAAVFRDLGCTGYLESGSIGLKICRVADGTADLFVKDVTVRDWDLAAPELVLREAGGHLVDGTGRAVRYGRVSRAHRGLVAAGSSALTAEASRLLPTAAGSQATTGGAS